MVYTVKSLLYLKENLCVIMIKNKLVKSLSKPLNRLQKYHYKVKPSTHKKPCSSHLYNTEVRK